MAAIASSTRKPANSLGDLQSGILSQIGKLSSPTPQSLAESDFNAAAANLGSGVPFNSAFGQNRRLVLRDSEQRARLQQAADLLNPSLNRASAESQAAAERQAALERLNISEGGQTTRQGLQLQNALKMQGIEGEQAMQRLLTGQTGQERLQRLGNSADLQKLILSAYLDPEYSVTPATPYQPAQYNDQRNPLTGTVTSTLINPAQAAQPARRSMTSNINTLLAQYGIQNPLNLSEYGLN
jgi:hypothetical protein